MTAAIARIVRFLSSRFGPRLTAADARGIIDVIPAVGRLGPAERARLDGYVDRFLRDVRIEGLRGAAPTDEERLRLAACAAVMFVGRPDWPFPRIRKIRISPIPLDERGEPGDSGRLGGYYDGGVITLCRGDLDASFRSSSDGYHIVFHELAHSIDADLLDGVPFPLAGKDAASFRTLVEGAGRSVRAGRSTLRPYAAKDAAETFAVAVESFFERPRKLRAEHPELYAGLTRLLRLDPAEGEPDARSTTPER